MVLLKKQIAVLMLFLAAALTSNLLSAATVPADQLIKTTSELVLKALEEQQEQLKKDPNHVYKLVDEIILPHIDFEKMAKLALGKNWRKANAAQKKSFTAAFRQLLVRTYSKSLSEYTGQKLIYLPFKMKAGDTKATVKTEIDQKSGFPIPVTYSLFLKGSAWKVYDIKIDGLSLVTNYRGSFAKEIRAKGVGALIKKLEDKNKQES
ncbi:MAG: ABC transporter substrate-binding protein [Gammaproteobacteria bacterium]|nr:ABC transporter substrate-binding protein [Gammaproteobacteria bacterium]